MPLVIRDETAGVVLVTIGDDGLVCFGEGTPVSPLTVSSIAMVDNNGLISNQRVRSNALAGAHGSVNVGPGQTVVVSTMPGRIPTVALDIGFPSFLVTFTPASPGVPAFCNPPTPDWNSTSHKLTGLTAGQFSVHSNDIDHTAGMCTSPNPTSIDYRWM